MSATPGRIHILNQYLWPDSAPTGLYAEMLADRLTAEGTEVVLVGGGGTYRASQRSAPATRIVRLRAQKGRRGSHLSTLGEYWSVSRAFHEYLQEEVRAGDVVVVTSAPPSTIYLHRVIRSRGATAIYWLQDYYPDLLRGVWRYPEIIRRMLEAHWLHQLQQWNHVVKSGANLGYHGANATVIRNWPTLEFPDPSAPEPATALYTGNFGYGHDVPSFVAVCDELKQQGYLVTVRGDGPGMSMLPSWIETGPAFASAEELHQALLSHEVHLVAAHPEIRTAIFPSKIWNSLAAGRRVVASGFAGEMAEELKATLSSEWNTHLEQWARFVQDSRRAQPMELSC